MSDCPRILVVDDEARLADLFAAWIEPEYPVRTAYDGEAALEVIDGSVDIVLLDRRMPGVSGDDVLAAIREEGYDCRVVMVTAVDPDFDIIEMGFDDYLVKPVSKEELLEMIGTIETRTEYESEIDEYYALVPKKALLESEKTDRALEDHEEYQRLCERVEELREQVDTTVTGLSEEGFAGAFRDLDVGEGQSE